MRIAILSLCLAAAAVFLMLLNGQVFTNSLISLAALGVAFGTSLTAVLNRRRPVVSRRLWGLTALLIAILMIGVARGLPAARSFQRDFNEGARRVRERLAAPPRNVPDAAARR